MMKANDKKKAYLTIDDSPTEDMQKKVDFLRENNIPAIFFCIGENLGDYLDVAIDAIKKGFIIGNHSYSHLRFSKITKSQAIIEIQRTEVIINKLYRKAGVKRPCKLFRFPYGDKGRRIAYYSKYGNRLPSKIVKLFDGTIGRLHKRRIQHFLKNNGFKQPKFKNINYPFFYELGFNSDYDVYWTFDFIEYTGRPLTNLLSRMDNTVTKDQFYGEEYKVGSLVDTQSNDVLLIHDQNETTEQFYELIQKCLDMNISFIAPDFH